MLSDKLIVVDSTVVVSPLTKRLPFTVTLEPVNSNPVLTELVNEFNDAVEVFKALIVVVLLLVYEFKLLDAVSNAVNLPLALEVNVLKSVLIEPLALSNEVNLPPALLVNVFKELVEV
jgi:hypothetical protein